MKQILCIGFSAPPAADYGALLRTSGYAVKYGSLQEVLPSIRTGELSADLLLVECRTMSRGEDLHLWQLRRAAPDIPLVLMANCESVESYLRSQTLGVQEYICSPAAERDVLRTVRKLIGEQKQRNDILPEQHVEMR